MLICRLSFALRLFLFWERREPCEFPIDGLLKLEVENYSGDFAARCDDVFGFFLVELVDSRIVFRFACLHESVVEDLILVDILPTLGKKKSLPFRGKSQVDGPIRVANGAPEKFLAEQVVNLSKCLFLVSRIADTDEVAEGDGPKCANVGHRFRL